MAQDIGLSFRKHRFKSGWGRLQKALPRSFFARPTLTVAKELLGKFLVRKIGRKMLAGMITEVEAYVGPNDRASHASRGRTKRNDVMFGKPGYWYVYLIYGMHYRLNIVTEKEGYPAAVLIRSVHLLPDCYGRNEMIVNGPGRVCRYFKVNKRLNKRLAAPETGLWIENRGKKQMSLLFAGSHSINSRVVTSVDRGVDPAPFLGCTSHIIVKHGKRIGVEYAGKWKNKLWKFYLACAK